jgi:hypothetical protein
MQTLKEIIKNKDFYISFSIPILTLLIFGNVWIGISIVALYGFIKLRDNILARAIFAGIILIYIVLIVFYFLGHRFL